MSDHCGINFGIFWLGSGLFYQPSTWVKPSVLSDLR
ncbi:hypothetical protein SLEP1_g17255 [Rubroshorea leprosula]|uniref:Uncharacterized protein n=1 Tax=Rubroshorea leprosula TaxID=152421 RepID=A0AAV5J193_9ROSI|nr:hypothetical protein SLEP1_g17255 [Rubroshorea leprosula]